MINPSDFNKPITSDRFVHELMEGDVILYDKHLFKYVKKLSFGGGGDDGYALFESITSGKTETIPYRTKVERVINFKGWENT